MLACKQSNEELVFEMLDSGAVDLTIRDVLTYRFIEYQLIPGFLGCQAKLIALRMQRAEHRNCAPFFGAWLGPC